MRTDSIRLSDNAIKASRDYISENFSSKHLPPQPNLYDFNFLAPCPASGLIVQGKKDDLVPPEETSRLAEKLKSQKNITVDYEEITGANHFYDNETDKLEKQYEVILRESLIKI